jgi:hypothetical protein
MNELVAVAVIVAAISGQPVASADREVARLRAHFAQVDRELMARDVSHLTADQRRARAVHITRLRAYAAAGVFPKNSHHPGAYVPYFVDDRGTRCAMGFLIEASGADDFVARVRARLNYSYIADIARDRELGPPLHAWLEANGLSLEEAARIQPGYPGNPEFPEVTTAYKVGSIVAIATELTSVAVNTSLVKVGLSRTATGLIGVTVGGAGLLLGVHGVSYTGGSGAPLVTVNIVMGSLALGCGLYALLDGVTAPAESRLSGAPWVSPDGRSGVLLNLSF